MGKCVDGMFIVVSVIVLWVILSVDEIENIGIWSRFLMWFLVNFGLGKGIYGNVVGSFEWCWKWFVSWV